VKASSPHPKGLLSGLLPVTHQEYLQGADNSTGHTPSMSGLPGSHLCRRPKTKSQSLPKMRLAFSKQAFNRAADYLKIVTISNVNIPRSERIRFNKRASRFNVIAH